MSTNHNQSSTGCMMGWELDNHLSHTEFLRFGLVTKWRIPWWCSIHYIMILGQIVIRGYRMLKHTHLVGRWSFQAWSKKRVKETTNWLSCCDDLVGVLNCSDSMTSTPASVSDTNQHYLVRQAFGECREMSGYWPSVTISNCWWLHPIWDDDLVGSTNVISEWPLP